MHNLNENKNRIIEPLWINARISLKISINDYIAKINGTSRLHGKVQHQYYITYYWSFLNIITIKIYFGFHPSFISLNLLYTDPNVVRSPKGEFSGSIPVT